MPLFSYVLLQAMALSVCCPVPVVPEPVISRLDLPTYLHRGHFFLTQARRSRLRGDWGGGGVGVLGWVRLLCLFPVVTSDQNAHQEGKYIQQTRDREVVRKPK
jgi:hypothetical protein